MQVVKDDGIDDGLLVGAGTIEHVGSMTDLLTFMAAAARDEGTLLGMGYNTYTSETRGFAVLGDAVSSPSGDGGQEVEFAVHEVEDRESLREHMGIAASASYSGIFSVDAKAKWSSDRTIDARNFYLLISVTVTNSATDLKKYELTPEARAMLGKKPDWKGFYARYGDKFVSSVITGGEFHALYEFKTRSRKDKDELKAALKGSYGLFKANADFQKSLEQIKSCSELSATCFIRGGRGLLPDIQSPQKIVEAALQFPLAVDPEKGKPIAYKIATKDFKVVNGFPASGKVPFYGSQASQNKRRLSALARLNDRVTDIQRMLSSGIYEDSLRNQIAELKEKIEDQALTLVNEIDEQHPETPEFYDDFEKIRSQTLWQPITGDLVHVSVGSHTHIWGLDRHDKAFRWDEEEEKWEEKSGKLFSDISVGTDGFVLGLTLEQGLFTWDEGTSAWKEVRIGRLDAGGALQPYPQATPSRLSVKSARNIWFLAEDAFPYYCNDEYPEKKYLLIILQPDLNPTGIRAVSQGSDNTIWFIGPQGNVYSWGREKQQHPGELKQISVGDSNHVWGIDTRQKVVRWTGEAWQQIPGALSTVSVGEDGTVWGITSRGGVVRFNGDV